jgi:protein-disulfide isomerase
VNRRVPLIGAAVLVLLAAVFALIRGGHPIFADRGGADSGTSNPATAAGAAPASAAPVDAAPVSETAAEGAVREWPAAAAPQSAVMSLPDLDPREALGSKSAPIVMEVFSDFQCPACKTLYVTTNRQLMDNYVSTGKVYLIHRDFPLPMHAHSRVAAQYCRAAAQIGKLEPVSEALFQNQEKWEQSGDVDGTVAAVLSSAEMTKVRGLVKSGAVDAAIDKDKALGQTYRVNQTPTTIFHSKGQTFPYAGVMSWDILHQFLDQLLSQR